MRWISAVLFAALAGSAQAQPAPQPLVLLDVPFISQSEALCGGAAAAMVLRYWGERGLNAESFAPLIDRSAAGIRTTALVGDLRRRGWAATALDGGAETIAAEIAEGRPVITLIEDRPHTFHYIVIVGVTADAIVFHDPARAPMRVMGRQEFLRRWQAANRWMAVVVPGDRTTVDARPERVAREGTSCDPLIARGIELARANDLEGAERVLTGALSCSPGPAMRELAGVRLLQQRWSDVAALSAAAAAIDPKDEYTWRLLGTSRFLENDRKGALEAWNHVGEPRVDLIRINGLERTRQRVVERLIDVQSGSVLTKAAWLRADRRLRSLPSASSTSLEYVPVPTGVAELRGTVLERPLFPRSVWDYVAVSATAAARQEITLTSGALTGGGERLTIDWRFWPMRRRIGITFEAPAPWGGVWGAEGATEHERFDVGTFARARRDLVAVRWSNWITSTTQLLLDGGLDRWNRSATSGRAGLQMRVESPDSRLELTGAAEGWFGERRFAQTNAAVIARSSTARTGFVFLGRAGAGAMAMDAPAMLWFGGDTGRTRPTLLRAHPLVGDGGLRADRLGRRMLHASGEAQRWWPVSLLRVGAAAFVDTARLSHGIDRQSRSDVDAGIGARIAVPGLSGSFRIDLAKGLRDGATAWSFVYEPEH